MERPLTLGASSTFLQVWLEIEMEKLQELSKMKDITLSMLSAMMLQDNLQMSTTLLISNPTL